MFHIIIRRETRSKTEYYISGFTIQPMEYRKVFIIKIRIMQIKSQKECHTNHDGKTYLAINNSLLNG